MKESIRKAILDLGADICGFSHIDRFEDAPEGFHPKDIFKACRSVIVFGMSLPKGLYHVPPRLIYGHYNDITCPESDRIALLAAKFIEQHCGGIAVPLPCDSPYEYWEANKMEGRGLISMKHAAVKAGLGTLGKSTLLLSPQYGNTLTIGAILTDLALESDALAENICIEDCTLCVENCPSGALDGSSANQKACRTNTYGNTTRGFSTVDCNMCRTVCPMRFGVQG
jgi:epoxyqueuosine reductase QueG